MSLVVDCNVLRRFTGRPCLKVRITLRTEDADAARRGTCAWRSANRRRPGSAGAEDFRRVAVVVRVFNVDKLERLIDPELSLRRNPDRSFGRQLVANEADADVAVQANVAEDRLVPPEAQHQIGILRRLLDVLDFGRQVAVFIDARALGERIPGGAHPGA